MRPVLTVAQMREVDRRAMAAGTPGRLLMERAGVAVAAVAGPLASGGRVVVACGPGNNGGDGFVVARLLAEAGLTVDLGLLGRREDLKGDAALAAGDWPGETRPLAEVWTVLCANEPARLSARVISRELPGGEE